LNYEKEYFLRQNSSFSLPVHTALLLGDSAGGIARELWWTNQEFYPVNHSTMVLHDHTSPGDEQ
jgi:hypothetical protein